MPTNEQYQPGYTYRTKCGNGRSTYDPEWSKTKPWSVVVKGTVTNYAESLAQAKQLLAKAGCQIE